MSTKATVSRGMGAREAAQSPVIDLESPDSVDALAKSLGVESETRIGTGEGSEALPEPAAAPQVAVAVRPPQGVSRFNESSGGALSGEFDDSDLKRPQLKIVNGSGELSQKFNQGTVLFADEPLWLPPNLQPGAKNPSLIFVPMQVRKQFRENLTQDEVQEGLMPRVVDSKAEAESMGGGTQWVGNTKPRWSPSAACVFLIGEPEFQDRPEDNRHPQFTMEMDGRRWSLGMYYAGGVAYGESARIILSNAYTVLRETVDGTSRIVLHKRLWTFQVTKKKCGNFSIFVPSIRLTRENTGPEAVAFIEGIMGGKTNV